jgi:hypothetical protein
LLVPLLVYAVAVAGQTVALVGAGGLIRAAAAAPLLVAAHIFYGAGFWRGLFTKLKPPGIKSDVPVQLEILGR